MLVDHKCCVEGCLHEASFNREIEVCYSEMTKQKARNILLLEEIKNKANSEWNKQFRQLLEDSTKILQKDVIYGMNIPNVNLNETSQKKPIQLPSVICGTVQMNGDNETDNTQKLDHKENDTNEMNKKQPIKLPPIIFSTGKSTNHRQNVRPRQYHDKATESNRKKITTTRPKSPSGWEPKNGAIR